MKKLNARIRTLRNEFKAFSLDEKNVSKSPLNQFEKWLLEAVESDALEVNAMTLATITSDGFVDARIVLLRGFDAKGFSFFSNYKSIKGRAIRHNKNVCLNFFWPELQRQIRIRGKIEKLSSRASDQYFSSRPRESQLAAWASHQSEKLNSRKELDDRLGKYERQFAGKKVSRPPHWGGYIVAPLYYEFWQGRPSRLHDRIVYEKSKNGKWIISRINP